MIDPLRTPYSWSSAALIVLMTVLLSGCVDTKYIIRQVDQHPAGEFNTVETSGERTISIPYIYSKTEFLGINFWNCLQSDIELDCERICDDEWDRICAPELGYEFGTVSRPGAGVVMARARAKERSESAVATQEEADNADDVDDVDDVENIDGEPDEFAAEAEDDAVLEDDTSEEEVSE